MRAEGLWVLAVVVVAATIFVERLACFKVPEIIEFRTSLPRGEYGKVLKKPLIDPINQHGKATQ